METFVVMLFDFLFALSRSLSNGRSHRLSNVASFTVQKDLGRRQMVFTFIHQLFLINM